MSSTKDNLLAEKSNVLLDDEARTLKKQKDYVPEVTEVINKMKSSLDDGSIDLDSAIVELLAWEKKARLASDADATILLVECIIDSCIKKQQWTTLNEQIVILSKRRAQLIKVVKHIVTHSMTYLDATPSSSIKKELIQTIRSVCDGKIFLEIERASLTRTLATMYEEEGNVADACDMLLDVAVETVGSMEFKDRADFLIEQLRLCLLKKDWLRAELTMKKLQTKQFSNASWVDLRLRFHTLLLELYAQQGNCFELCRCWKVIFDIYYKKSKEDLERATTEATKSDSTDKVTMSDDTTSTTSTDKKEKKDTKDDKKTAETPEEKEVRKAAEAAKERQKVEEEKKRTIQFEDALFIDNENTTRWKEALGKTLLYYVLSPKDYETEELANRIAEEKKALMVLGSYRDVFDSMRGPGIVSWPLVNGNLEEIQEEIHADSIFSTKTNASKEDSGKMTDDTTSSTSTSSAFASATDRLNAASKTIVKGKLLSGDELWSLLRRRVCEKNISVIAKHYTNISLERLCGLTKVSKDEVEEALGSLIDSKQLTAKIDSPKSVVIFKGAQTASQILDTWGAEFTQLLNLVEVNSGLIQKENLQYNI